MGGDSRNLEGVSTGNPKILSGGAIESNRRRH